MYVNGGPVFFGDGEVGVDGVFDGQHGGAPLGGGIEMFRHRRGDAVRPSMGSELAVFEMSWRLHAASEPAPGRERHRRHFSFGSCSTSTSRWCGRGGGALVIGLGELSVALV